MGTYQYKKNIKRTLWGDYERMKALKGKRILTITSRKKVNRVNQD